VTTRFLTRGPSNICYFPFSLGVPLVLEAEENPSYTQSRYRHRI